MIDACRIGLCELYATGGGAFGIIIGCTIGALVIVRLIRRRQRTRRKEP